MNYFQMKQVMDQELVMDISYYWNIVVGVIVAGTILNYSYYYSYYYS